MKKGLAVLLAFTVILFMFACRKDSYIENSVTNVGTSAQANGETSDLFKGYTYVDENGSTVCVDESLLCSVPTKPAENPTNTFQEIRTSWLYSRDSEYLELPYTVIIESSDELKKYIAETDNKFDLSRKTKVYADTTIGFLDAVDKYDDEYFEENSLIIAVTGQPSGSIRYKGASLICSPGGKLCDTLILTEFHPHEGTDDYAHWHIIVEAEKDTYADEIKLKINEIREETPDCMK